MWIYYNVSNTKLDMIDINNETDEEQFKCGETFRITQKSKFKLI